MKRPLRLRIETPLTRWRPPTRDPEVARFLRPQPRLAAAPRPSDRPDAGHLAHQLLGHRVITLG